MSGSPKIALLCSDLAAVLSPQQPYFAGLATELETVARINVAQAASVYCSLDWWGGSGSIADAGGAESPNSIARVLIAKLIELRDEFTREGYRCDLADGWAEVFRKWLADGIFDEGSSA